MEIINLTPHAVTFVTESGNTVIEPSGTVARVSSHTEVIGDIDCIPVTRTVFGEVENLPVGVGGAVYVVSSIVAARVPNRDDVFIPNDSVRDDCGRIIGCRSLGRI